MIRLVAWLMLFACQAAAVFAAQTVPGIESNQPIEITSQQLEVLQSERKSVFTGEVVAKQGDMTLYADELTVFFLKEGNQIDRLEATGNVKFTQLDRTATADKAVYRQNEEILLLTGNAQVKQGANQIAGDEITLYVRENRSLIKSSAHNRVKAVIVPDKQKATQ